MPCDLRLSGLRRRRDPHRRGAGEEGYEECDDGNDDNLDDCSNSRELQGCGDGELQPELGEICDDGNEIDTDACTNRCRNAGCGDGTVWEGNEECTTATATFPTPA